MRKCYTIPMQKTKLTEDQIRTQFVTSLMNYFKIEEDIFLRSHIDELIRPIPTNRYHEFLHRLSTREMPYKTGIEKIAAVAEEFLDESLSLFEHEARSRTDNLYHLMYDLRSKVLSSKTKGSSALEQFENVRFDSIRKADSEEKLLDATDMDVVKTLGKQWIYDYVSLDRGLFEKRVEFEYNQAIGRREHAKYENIIGYGEQSKMISAKEQP